MKKGYFVIVFLYISLIVKTIPPPCGNELIEKEKVYAQEKAFTTDTSVSRAYFLYYFGINPTKKNTLFKKPNIYLTALRKII